MRDLRSFDGRLCVVRSDGVLDFWQQGRDVHRGPLVTYLEGFDAEVWRAGDYAVFASVTATTDPATNGSSNSISKAP